MSWLKKVREEEALVAAKPKAIPKPSPTKGSQDWLDQQDSIFEDRLDRCVSLGINLKKSTEIALKLYVRDFDDDDRTLCYECKHLSRYADGWRCQNFIAANVSFRESGSGLGQIIDLLQQCNGYAKP